jgi:hypothetical protein
VAAGTFLGASALAQPALALLAALALGLRLRPWKDAATRIRLGLAAGVALLLAAPLLWRCARALSAEEAAALPSVAAASLGARRPGRGPGCFHPGSPMRRPALLAALGLLILWRSRPVPLGRSGDRARAPQPRKADYAAIDRIAARPGLDMAV